MRLRLVLTVLFLSLLAAWPERPAANSTARIVRTRGDGAGPLFLIQRDWRWGFMDAAGSLVIPPRFGESADFYEGLACVQLDGHYGYIDERGEFVIPPIFDRATSFEDGIAIVSILNEAFLINKAGARLTRERFLRIDRFTEGLTAVEVEVPSELVNGSLRERSRFGFIDKTGHMVIEPLFDEVRGFSEGLAAVSLGRHYRYDRGAELTDSGRWGYINQAGRMMIPPQYTKANPFLGGVAVVSGDRTDRFGVIDTMGRVVRPFDLHEIDPLFIDGVASARDEHGTGFIGTNGRFRFQRKDFSLLSSLEEGLAHISMTGGRDGFVDRDGVLRIPARFVNVGYFHDGLASAMNDKDLWGFIDKAGTVVIPFQFEQAEEFYDGLARVAVLRSTDDDEDGDGDDEDDADDSVWCYIDRSGRIVARGVLDY
jgi:hypothetical protein